LEEQQIYLCGAIVYKERIVVVKMVDGEVTATSSGPMENVSELRFGSEFQDIHILSNAQVAVILQVSAHSAVNRDEELNDVYRKTQKYVNRFNTMTNPEKEHQELVDELDNLQEYVIAMLLLYYIFYKTCIHY
jgi:hypothetical protein